MIWSACASAVLRCETTRQVASPRSGKPLPQLLLRLDVQRARQVVEYVEFRIPHEHPGRGGPLHLAAGELHAARTDDRLQPAVQMGDVVFHHRSMHRLLQAVPASDGARAKYYCAAYRCTARDSARYTRFARREEGAGSSTGWPFHAIDTRFLGQQAKQRPNKRRLAGADRPVTTVNEPLSGRAARPQCPDPYPGTGKSVRHIQIDAAARGRGGRR